MDRYRALGEFHDRGELFQTGVFKMKKCFILLIIFLFIINNITFAALNSYPVNSNPATEDRMLGIDDPTGTWSTKLYSLSSVFNLFQSQNYNFTGAVDFSNATSISSGPLIFTSSGTLPEAVDGRLFYYSGLGYNAFGFYSLTTPRYILDYGSAPADGQVLVYRTGTGFTWETKTSLPNGTNANDILSWDGDSWEPIALSDHPAFAELLTAFNNAGLNSFVFTPNTTFPLWAGASPVSVSFDVTDTSSAYAIDTVNFQYDGTGGFVNALTNTTGDTYTGSVTIAADGAHTIQLEASDDKSTPNTGRSATYTINFDGTLPVVNAGSDQTHDGTGQQITVSGITITEANETARERQIYNTTDAAVQSTWAAFTGTSFAYTLPANTDSYRFDVRITDPIRSVTDSVNVAYSTGGGTTVNDAFDGTENPLVTNWTNWAIADWVGFQKSAGSAYGISSAWNGSYWDADQLAGNQYAKITLTSSPGYHGVMVRQNTNGCYVAYASSHGTRVYVNRFDVSGAVWTNLVSGASYITTTVPSGATLELRFSGSTPTVLVNGTPVGTLINDSTYTSGNAGVVSYGQAVGITSFEAGDL